MIIFALKFKNLKMFKKISVLISIVFIVAACSTNKEITQTRNTGINSFTEGDYNTALLKFAELIDDAKLNGGMAKVEDYEGAGKSAYALALIEEALSYLEIAKDLKSSDENVYYALADIYHIKDNLSKEIRYLEFYQANYPEGAYEEIVQLRLFEAYVATESWEQGLVIWPLVKNKLQFQELITEGYFKINEALKNESECEKTAKDLLKINSDNQLALKWSAERFFWKAENRYQKEIAAYNKKKTNSQYAKLLKALNIVTSDFKRSRDFFEKLYVANPLPEYARFLGNIYNRLDDKAKAKYYQSKIG